MLDSLLCRIAGHSLRSPGISPERTIDFCWQIFRRNMFGGESNDRQRNADGVHGSTAKRHVHGNSDE